MTHPVCKNKKGLETLVYKVGLEFRWLDYGAHALSSSEESL